jgi:small conductance mechanosensitive channel
MTVREAWSLWHVAGAMLLVVAGAVIGTWAAGVMALLLERTQLDPGVRNLVVRAVRPLVIVLAVIAALDLLAIDLTALAVMLGAATLALGLAMQPTLSHAVSGGVLLTLRPYREGETVTCAGLEGKVVEQGALAVVLERPDGTLATIPNGVVFSHPILNHVRIGRRRVDLTVTVPPGADLAGLRFELVQALARDPRVLPSPEPAVAVALGADATRLEASAWVAPADREAVESELAVTVAGLVRAHVAERVAGRR